MMTFTDGTRTWPSRYYADLNKPCGYYDLAGMGSLLKVPDADKLFALTDAQWASRMTGGRMLSMAVVDGTFGAYTQPAPVAVSTSTETASTAATTTATSTGT